MVMNKLGYSILLFMLLLWAESGTAKSMVFDETVVHTAFNGIDVRIRCNYTYNDETTISYPNTWSTVAHITVINRRNYTITYDYHLRYRPSNQICGNFGNYQRILTQLKGGKEQYHCRLVFFYFTDRVRPHDVEWELVLKTSPQYENLVDRGKEILAKPQLTVQDISDAINIFSDALRLDPSRDELRSYIETLEQERKELSARLSERELFNTYIKQAWQSERRENYEDAIRLYKLALELDPTNQEIPKRLQELREARISREEPSSERPAELPPDSPLPDVLNETPVPPPSNQTNEQNQWMVKAELEKAAMEKVATEKAAAEKAAYAAYQERQLKAREEKLRAEAAEKAAYRARVDSLNRVREEQVIAAQKRMAESIGEVVDEYQAHWRVIERYYVKKREKYIPIEVDSALVASFQRAATAKGQVNDFLDAVDEDALEASIIDEMEEERAPCEYLVPSGRLTEFGDPFMGGVVDTGRVSAFLNHVLVHGCPADTAEVVTEIWVLSREEALAEDKYGLEDRTVFNSAVVVRKGWRYYFGDGTNFTFFSGAGGRTGVMFRKSLQYPDFWTKEIIWGQVPQVGVPK